MRDFYERLKNADEQELDHIVDFFLFEGVPFGLADWDEYCCFRRDLATGLAVNAKSIVIVGSGRMGFCLSPRTGDRQKLWRPFGDESDFDVVVVDHVSFDNVWNQLLDHDDRVPPKRGRRERKRTVQRWRDFIRRNHPGRLSAA